MELTFQREPGTCFLEIDGLVVRFGVGVVPERDVVVQVGEPHDPLRSFLGYREQRLQDRLDLWEIKVKLKLVMT